VERWIISASRLPKSALSTGAMLSVCKRLRNSSTSSGSHDLPLPLVSFSGMCRQRDASGAIDYGVAKFPIDLYSRAWLAATGEFFNSARNHLLLSAFGRGVGRFYGSHQSRRISSARPGVLATRWHDDFARASGGIGRYGPSVETAGAVPLLGRASRIPSQPNLTTAQSGCVDVSA
jgi:hypothetical protein